MKYEYKNYDIPLSDGKHKWSLLKTIVSFLNSKGGTIFVGVEDNNCKVVGKLLSGKVRDEFKLTLKHLTERIVPAIDLTDKEELSVQFIPVVKGKSFSGRYVTKINVKQGEPTQTYCFVQKLQIQSETK
jgi:predicted HTH transcriptional regulator